MTDPRARLADAWWASLSPARQVQIFQWIAGREAALDHPPIPGQIGLFEEVETRQ